MNQEDAVKVEPKYDTTIRVIKNGRIVEEEKENGQ